MAKLTERDKEALKADHITGEYTQQQLADKYGISKGMVNRYIKPSKSKQIIDEEVRIKGDLLKLEEEKSKHLSKQEAIEVNNQVEKRLKALYLTDDTNFKLLYATQRILDRGTVEDKIGIGNGIQQFEPRSLNPSDIEKLANATEKAGIGLGAIQKQPNQNINVNTQNNIQNNALTIDEAKKICEKEGIPLSILENFQK